MFQHVAVGGVHCVQHRRCRYLDGQIGAANGKGCVHRGRTAGLHNNVLRSLRRVTIGRKAQRITSDGKIYQFVFASAIGNRGTRQGCMLFLCGRHCSRYCASGCIRNLPGNAAQRLLSRTCSAGQNKGNSEAKQPRPQLEMKMQGIPQDVLPLRQGYPVRLNEPVAAAASYGGAA
jgi:hypothetical protein